MFDLIRANQMDIMLLLCAVCATVTVLMLYTRFLGKKRKWILIILELQATLLLAFDRQAYIYSGNTETVGYVMVRLSNFMVFFLTSGIMLFFNLFLMNLLYEGKEVKQLPRRMTIVNILALIGMIMVIFSQFTGLYYSFDESNRYQRGPGFLLSYVMPILCSLIEYTVIFQFRKRFSRLLFIAFNLYIFVPIAMGVLQIFTYGLSITNISLVIVSICLYVFTYLDINDEVEKGHRLEMQDLQEEKKSMKRLFEQTAGAFVSAVDKRESGMREHSIKVARYARELARLLGKSEEECDEIYYAALLHEVGVIGIPEEEEKERPDQAKKQKLLIGTDILSNISEYPFLSDAARYSSENYDGSGFPDGLKGEEIPEVARIVAVADDCVCMMSGKDGRDPLPLPKIRMELGKGSGKRYDPEICGIMMKLLDSDSEQADSEDTQLTEPGGRGEDTSSEGDIPEESRAGDRVESDVPDIRIKSSRSATTEGMEVKDGMQLLFHTRSLSTAELVWHCPYLLIFSSADGRVGGKDYREYALVKLNGENENTEEDAENSFFMQKKPAFPGWEEWKKENKKGLECSVSFEKKKNRITLFTENLGIAIENTVTIPTETVSVYVALTGDQCALSDIRCNEGTAG